MKHYFIPLLTFLMIIKVSYSQKSGYCFIDFDNTMYCQGDTLYIDSVNNQNNVWQIGQPNKLNFQSSYSPPNAIVTKLNTFYPPNDTSSFIIAHIADFGLAGIGTMWIDAFFKINSDTISDYGTIEFSPNNGITWINLLTDTIYSQYFYYWDSEKPVLSGNSNEWQWFSIWISDNSHYFGISYGDTVLWRFTFISDSIQSNKDGWMLDNIKINDWFEDVPNYLSETRNINVYPNPFSKNTIIHSKYLFRSAIVTVYDFFGQIVKKQGNINGSIINFNRDNLSNGIYFLTHYCPVIN